jgi:hypothetical protein
MAKSGKKLNNKSAVYWTITHNIKYMAMNPY